MIIKISLEKLIEKIGYEEQYGEDNMIKSLRLLAVKWACKLDSVRCKIAANIKLIQYLNQTLDTPYVSFSL